MVYQLTLFATKPQMLKNTFSRTAKTNQIVDSFVVDCKHLTKWFSAHNIVFTEDLYNETDNKSIKNVKF